MDTTVSILFRFIKFLEEIRNNVAIFCTFLGAFTRPHIITYKYPHDIFVSLSVLCVILTLGFSAFSDSADGQV